MSEAESGQTSGTERRRTKRLPLTFHIEVSGRDPNGKVFQDHAVTTDVNETGCRFDLLRQLYPGDLITIRLEVENSEAVSGEDRCLFEVVWATPSERGWSVGATMLNPGTFWPIVFPHAKSKLPAP